ncbi:MAG: AAA family ATPase [Desulfobacteraceae bacterium]|nr:AAA family ATPase [Desulfobacteraceae bacterium]
MAKSGCGISRPGRQNLCGDFPKSSDKIMWAAMSPDGSRVASVGRDALVHIFNTSDGSEKQRFVGHESIVYRVAFSPDGQGFFRFFFNLLKTATSEKGSGLFITGVSPVTMDDVTSGMNIGKNLSRNDKFNEMTGLTEYEVKACLTYYADAGMFEHEVQECLNIMKIWYNNYMFSNNAKNLMFNPDMVLYFLTEISSTRLPEDMIDR